MNISNNKFNSIIEKLSNLDLYGTVNFDEGKSQIYIDFQSDENYDFAARLHELWEKYKSDKEKILQNRIWINFKKTVKPSFYDDSYIIDCSI